MTSDGRGVTIPISDVSKRSRIYGESDGIMPFSSAKSVRAPSIVSSDCPKGTSDGSLKPFLLSFESNPFIR